MKYANFLKEPKVFKAFEKWIYCPTLFSHAADRDYFYKFVNCAVYYVKHIPFMRRKDAWKTIDMDVFKEYLSRRFAELKENNPEEFENRLHDAVVKFEMLIEYEKANDRVLWFNQIEDNRRYLEQSA